MQHRFFNPKPLRMLYYLRLCTGSNQLTPNKFAGVLSFCNPVTKLAEPLCPTATLNSRVNFCNTEAAPHCPVQLPNFPAYLKQNGACIAKTNPRGSQEDCYLQKDKSNEILKHVKRDYSKISCLGQTYLQHNTMLYFPQNTMQVLQQTCFGHTQLD